MTDSYQTLNLVTFDGQKIKEYLTKIPFCAFCKQIPEDHVKYNKRIPHKYIIGGFFELNDQGKSVMTPISSHPSILNKKSSELSPTLQQTNFEKY